MLKIKEVELIVEVISGYEKEISKLQDTHLDIMIGDISFDTIEEKNKALETIEEAIEHLNNEIKELKK